MTAEFVPTIWSREIHRGNQARLVTQEGIVNHDYEGDITQAGDTVHINGLEPVTIKDYDRAEGLGDPERLEANRRTLVIDQMKAFDFLVDDIEKVQANADLLGAATGNASRGLVAVQDDFVLDLMVKGAATKATKALAESDEKAFFNKVVVAGRTALNKASVTSEGRFIVTDPEGEAYLSLDPRFIANGSSESDERLLNGQVGRIGGFRVLVSNSAKVAGKAVIGTPDATTVADQIVKVRGMESERYFGTRVSGLHVYGAKVTRPENLFVVTYTVSGE